MRAHRRERPVESSPSWVRAPQASTKARRRIRRMAATCTHRLFGRVHPVFRSSSRTGFPSFHSHRARHVSGPVPPAGRPMSVMELKCPSSLVPFGLAFALDSFRLESQERTLLRRGCLMKPQTPEALHMMSMIFRCEHSSHASPIEDIPFLANMHTYFHSPVFCNIPTAHDRPNRIRTSCPEVTCNLR